jgi:transposase
VEPKKRSLGASERDEFLRAAWRLLFARAVDAERLVFVDEMGTNVSLSPLYAWSRRGERAFGSTPRNWGKNVTLLTSITAEGIGPCLAVEGATTREVFEAYLERALAPSLPPGQVVVMYNLSAHKGGRVREIVESAGCELVYLPPYLSRTTTLSRNLYENVKPQIGSRTWSRHAASPTEHRPSFGRARSGLGYASCPHASYGRRRPWTPERLAGWRMPTGRKLFF